MKLIRLRLTNYRGIESSEVEFDENGITIVEGPNEAGKTSLGEAINVLFENLDSSKKQLIKDIKPVSKDVGPEIELTARSGQYEFTYRKRFLKSPETTLDISAPSVENHTGREAHDRANALLEETIDVDLWKALSIQQGEAIQQADLSGQSALSSALDRAAGGQSADPREDSLYDRIKEENEIYFTAGGREKAVVKDARGDAERHEEEIEELEGKIRGVEKDVALSSELVGELERLKIQQNGLAEDISGYDVSLQEITKLEAVLERVELKMSAATSQEDSSKREWKGRETQLSAVKNAKQALKELEDGASSKDSFTVAEAALLEVFDREKTRELAYRGADKLLDIRQADVEYLTNTLDLEQFEARKKRVDEARTAAASAHDLLASNSINAAGLVRIRETETLLVAARARLEASTSAVTLTGLDDVDFELDGEANRISKGEERLILFSDSSILAIPNIIELQFQAGSTTTELSEAVSNAKEVLQEACQEFGVDTVEQAADLLEQRNVAERAIDKEKQIRTDNLRDLSWEEIDRKVTNLSGSVTEYLVARPSEPALAGDLDSAKVLREEARGLAEQAETGWATARAQVEVRREKRDEIKELLDGENLVRALAKKSHETAVSDLARSRDDRSDEQLKLAFDDAKEQLKAVEKTHLEAARSLEEKNPDRVKGLAKTAVASLTTTNSRIYARSHDATAVKERLSMLGEEGLRERLDEAKRQSFIASRRSDAVQRRADAAELLFTVMKEERDHARRAYIAPLKKKIESLGSLVFNSSFEVQINDDLAVTSRVLDGSSVPFESLSGGTREQISLISRLACAILVSNDRGGVVIFDDALGYTDPARLKLMGVVFAKAAAYCQIIILTCIPERYANVGDAKVVRLG